MTNWLIIKDEAELEQEQAIARALKKYATSGTPSQLKTLIKSKQAELNNLLLEAKAKVKDTNAITNKIGWKDFETEGGIRMYIKHLEADIKWYEDNAPSI